MESTPVMEAPASETTTTATEERVTVFAEAGAMNEEQSVNVLIQAAQFAQESGNLSLRDSVLLARAIDVLRPGTI